MSLLLESICYTPEGFRNIDLHAARMERSGGALFPGHEPYNLARQLHLAAPAPAGKMKCRVLYDDAIREIQFIPYQARIINSVALVNADEIQYEHKFADRSALDTLKARVAEDEIIIVRNGLITDASYANLIFFDGEKWYTPAKPLLRGIQREKLLADGSIFPADISVAMLEGYTRFALINAMLGIDEAKLLDIGIITTR